MNPRLRRLNITRVPDPNEENGELLVFHDPTAYAPDLALDAGLAPLLALLDGTRSLEQLGEMVRRSDPDIPADWLAEFIAELDDNLLLDSPHFAAEQRERESDWHDATARSAAFAGRSYPDEFVELGEFLEAKRAQGKARLPARAYEPEKVRGIVTPHIDFHRGGHTEAASYAPLVENVRATGQSFDTLVVFGIAHAGVRYPFCALDKDYETPLGTMQCDLQFIASLTERVGPQLLAEGFAHKDEHSIEFSAVMCQHFAELKTARIVPILCGGFWESLRTGEAPESAEPQVGAFIEALRDVTKQHEAAGRKIGFIASVDGAHVGSQFGDDTKLTPAKLREIEREDRKWCAAIEAGDKAALHAHFAKDGNRFNVDAHPALYTIMAAFPDLRGQLLDYDQAYHEGPNIVVSFASLALFEA